MTPTTGQSAVRQPTQEDLERVAAATERVGLVIRVRWLIIAMLVGYSVVTLVAYAAVRPILTLAGYMIVPAIALVFVAGYNTWYQLTYRRLARIPYLGHAQIVMDILVATVLIHYSGGVNSWFWTMYMLYTVEAAFILEEEGDTWLVAAFCATIYGALLMTEYTGLIAPVTMPFVGIGLSKDFAYVAILWSWVLVMNLTVALVGNHIVRTLKARESDLRRSAVFDGLTGLYNRTHFLRLFSSEVARAKRYRRRVSVLVIDTDDIGEYNARFGHSAGDLLVRVVADVVARSVRRGDDSEPYEVDVAGRLGGGTFAILAPEVETPEAMVAAERLRETVQAVATPRPGSGIKRPTTVSIGVAAYPADGVDVGSVIGAAYEALAKAKVAGRNRVVRAGV